MAKLVKAALSKGVS